MDRSHDEDRDRILARRRKLITTALVGASITVASACAQPCLRFATDAGQPDAGEEADGGEADAGSSDQTDGG